MIIDWTYYDIYQFNNYFGIGNHIYNYSTGRVPIIGIGETLEGSSPLRDAISAQSLLCDKIERGSKVVTIINGASPL